MISIIIIITMTFIF